MTRSVVGGVRSPLLVRWPKAIKPGTEAKPIAGAIDLLPTLCELAGVKPVGKKPLDGIRLAQLLRGEKPAMPERIRFQQWAGRVSARSQTHRLDADGKLFDLVNDPEQKTDIAAKEPDLTAKLKMAVADWRKDVLAQAVGKDDRPYPVGHKTFPVTQLPARDGMPHGDIKRSAGAPNCSYFTNWAKTTDRTTWDVEVATAGKYRVEVLYTCAKDNLGVKLAATLGEAKLAKAVTEAHDPPAKGAENDRVPRMGESLVKDFKPLSLGEVKFERGRGTLTLSGTDIPGKQAVEVRGLVVTLVE